MFCVDLTWNDPIIMYSEMPCCSTSCNGKSSLLVVMSMSLEAVLIVWVKVASLYSIYISFLKVL